MSGQESESRVELLKKQLFELQNKRKQIEDELVMHKLVLDNNKVGMKDSLTDKDDFPRNDIDVYAVRHARSAINKLEFDASDIFNQMQSRLEELHALSKMMEIIVRTFNSSDPRDFRDEVHKYDPELGNFEPQIPEELRNFGKDINEIIFLTGNKNKLAELRSSLPLGVNTRLTCPAEKIDLAEIQDSSILNIVQDKCQRARERLIHHTERQRGDTSVDDPDDESKMLILVEDTCLNFEALNGMPGPYVKWFLEAIGPEGLFKMLAGFESRSAEAICTYALAALHADHNSDDSSSPNKPNRILFFRGGVKGRIVEPRQKSAGMGWGWDPVFEENHSRLTFAEMEPELKSSLSHRAKALKVLVAFLEI